MSPADWIQATLFSHSKVTEAWEGSPKSAESEHPICKEPVVASYPGSCLVCMCVQGDIFKDNLLIDFQDLENY